MIDNTNEKGCPFDEPNAFNSDQPKNTDMKNDSQMYSEKIKNAWIAEVGELAFEQAVKPRMDNEGWVDYDPEQYGEIREEFESKPYSEPDVDFRTTLIRPKSLSKPASNAEKRESGYYRTDFLQMRRDSGKTLRQVEDATGISNAYSSQLENGKIKNPSYKVVKTLNDFYGFSNPLANYNYQPENHLAITRQTETGQTSVKDATVMTFAVPKELHFNSKLLLSSCAQMLAKKMRKSEEKYGYLDGWINDDWEDECRDGLLSHISKGDPKDVAIYALFMMFHGWHTIPNSDHTETPKEVLEEALAVLESLKHHLRKRKSPLVWNDISYADSAISKLRNLIKA